MPAERRPVMDEETRRALLPIGRVFLSLLEKDIAVLAGETAAATPSPPPTEDDIRRLPRYNPRRRRPRGN
jgi:hypothetical protein